MTKTPTYKALIILAGGLSIVGLGVWLQNKGNARTRNRGQR